MGKMASANPRTRMNAKRDLPLSPRSSSGEADSPRGTSDVRLTVLAPGDAPNGHSTLPQMLARPNSLTPPAKSKVSDVKELSSANERDPFVTPGHSSKTRLSPTASAFSPWNGGSHCQHGEMLGPISAAFSKDLGVSRTLFMSSSQHLYVSEIEPCLQSMEMNRFKFHGKRKTRETPAGLWVQFSDIRDACLVYFQLQLLHTDWKIDYVTAARDQMMDENGEYHTEEGQVVVLAMFGLGSDADEGHILATVQRHLQENGCLFAIQKMDVSQEGAIQITAEFCEVSSAKAAIAKPVAHLEDENVHVIISAAKEKACTHDGIVASASEQTNPSSTTPHWSYGPPNAPGRHLPASSICIGPQVAMYPMFFSSAVPATIPYVLDSFVTSPQGNPSNNTTQITPAYRNMSSPFQTPPSPALTVQKNFSPSRSMNKYNRLDSRRQNALRVNRSPYQSSSSSHNHVDVDRIRDGIDVRTTIMLRNIPNKVDQTMLKRIVDESSWGKYDFMYLRIDFANDCNVGYAFINFVDPLDIIDFVEARGNQRWNCFKSDKVAEISYATIQGKDCLVQKFRNSSVMLEAAHYRPKLYFTSNGPVPEMAGQEEPFPEPDNQSKMKRSCENAEHVGLFTPNAGQHFRDEQRRRRSQYDRGTRLAALEEYDYEAALQQFQGIKL